MSPAVNFKQKVIDFILRNALLIELNVIHFGIINVRAAGGKNTFFNLVIKRERQQENHLKTPLAGVLCRSPSSNPIYSVPRNYHH